MRSSSSTPSRKHVVLCSIRSATRFSAACAHAVVQQNLLDTRNQGCRKMTGHGYQTHLPRLSSRGSACCEGPKWLYPYHAKSRGSGRNPHRAACGAGAAGVEGEVQLLLWQAGQPEARFRVLLRHQIACREQVACRQWPRTVFLQSSCGSHQLTASGRGTPCSCIFPQR